MTEPVVIVHEAARAALADDGRVVAFRPSPRSTGSTTWRESPDGPVRDPVLVSQIGPVEPDSDVALEPYRPLSGFGSLPAWREALRERHGTLPDVGYLYYVAVPDAAADAE